MRDAVSTLLACCLLACSSRGADVVDRPDASTSGPGAPAVAPDGGAPEHDAGLEQVDAGPPVPCPATLRFTPRSGLAFRSVEVTGEFNAWAQPGIAATGPSSDGSYAVELQLLPGLHAYKLLLDGAYELDASARLRKYVDGVENSAFRVPDCRYPALSLIDKTLTRPTADDGRFVGKVRFAPALAAAPGDPRAAPDPAALRVVLRRDGQDTPLAATLAADGSVALDAPRLADGKYTIQVFARDRAGRAAPPLRLVFWVEPETFDWHDAVIYMAMTDRLKNGDGSNDAVPTPGVDARADFHGGDLQGVRDVIRSGALDRLGVRAIWLSPFNTNPAGAYQADDRVHQVTGYHGYWPVKAREVDARIGGIAALKEMVREAHAHGIRVLQDFVVNHVHEQHEYVSAHPSWFRTGCVCGTSACDWTARRLDCLFASYLPDVNWTNNDAAAQFTADAVWWLTALDLDGLRIDAVKHVEDVAITNMAAAIRDELEPAGTKVFLTGETAMGWSDCNPANASCNAADYGTISRYIGPNGLDGQFDFVLYHAVPALTFQHGDRGLIHADVWARASMERYPAGAIMTPYIGSHDTARSVTVAQYRADRDVLGRKWDGVAAAPGAGDADAYVRHRLALAWLLGLPGAPLLYYGDEYGQWGGADPNNRADWRGDGALSAEESATRAFTEKLGAARRSVSALRRGAYVPISNSGDDLLVFARADGATAALVALSLRASETSVTVSLPASLGVPSGAVLRDRLGGATATVTGGSVTLSVPARGAAVFAP